MHGDLATSWRRTGARPVRALHAGDAQPGVPELVLVPGLGALGYLLPTVRACAAWTRVHLLDLPGFGSPVTAGLPARLDDLAPVLAAWLADLDAGPLLLAGHSTGAQIALRAALLRPDAVAGLVAAGGTFPPDARRPLPLLRRVLRTLPHESPRELPAVLPQYLRGARRLPQLLLSALRDRPEEQAPSLRCPLLVLRGRDDALCSEEWAERLAAAAPDGRVRTVPGAHNAPCTHPAEVAAALREFAVLVDRDSAAPGMAARPGSSTQAHLVGDEVLRATVADDQLGSRYVLGVAQ